MIKGIRLWANQWHIYTATMENNNYIEFIRKLLLVANNNFFLKDQSKLQNRDGNLHK